MMDNKHNMMNRAGTFDDGSYLVSTPQDFDSFEKYFDTFPALYTYLHPFMLQLIKSLPFNSDTSLKGDKNNGSNGDHVSKNDQLANSESKPIKTKNGDGIEIPSQFHCPIQSDLEYLSIYELLYALEGIIQHTYKLLFDGVALRKVTYEESHYTMKILQEFRDNIKYYVQSRLEFSIQNNYFIPRVVRLCRNRLNVGEKFEEAFLYVIIANSGSHLASIDMISVNALTIANYCNFNQAEFLCFLADDHPFMKNGLLDMDSRYQDTIGATVPKIPKEICLALSGSDLDAEAYLKISGTPLDDILREEPGFEEKFGARKVANKDINKNLNNDSNELNDEDLEDEREIDETEDLLTKLENTENPKELFEILKEADSINESVDVSSHTEFDPYHFQPYRSNIEYLDDHFQLIITRIKHCAIVSDQKMEESYRNGKDRSSEAHARELLTKVKLLEKKLAKRLELTQDFCPRMEKLVAIRKLDNFEKWILLSLVGNAISHDFKIAVSSCYSFGKDFNVAEVLFILCDTLQDRIAKRSFFYKNATLIADGMIHLDNRFGGDLMDCGLRLDRRILDYIVGLDSEFNEIVEGSHLFTPHISLDQVVLPKEQKELIMQTIENYDKYTHFRKKLGFDEIITYGNSLVMLFYGVSGAGKTMLAKAIATHLQKKMLLINFANLDVTGELLKLIFRESKINDAILFFDECESFFESRNKATSSVQALLTEIENFDGFIIMATNQPQDLDSAMQRRISLAIEFTLPDAFQREKIWRNHVPSTAKVSDDIDFGKLAIQYELSGGLIKNSVLSALSFAVSRTNSSNPEPIITHEDLDKGARFQLKNGLMQIHLDRRVVPTHGLDAVVVEEETMKLLKSVVRFEKARKILHSTWGFGKTKHNTATNNVFMYGAPGCGQSFSAEALAFEVGVPMKIIDISEIMARYTYPMSKNIHNLFQETQQSGTVLVIEISSPVNLEDATFQHLMNAVEHYSTFVIVISNVENIFDSSMLRRFKFVIPFRAPSEKLRLKLWRQLIPKEMPIDDDVDFGVLASRFPFNGRQIDSCIFKAASIAVLNLDNQVVNMKTLLTVCEEELKHTRGDLSFMFQ